ncbi:DUF4870 domain-containing protein [Streptomyces yerevanensis]|uniref:DUF4870 domain-containing protein n=1 Tax=Streptomyces yerevanensis TaxID=66378 RepID=UPI000526943A|nr:DUF4870 domain-containing protein [Streptomyces yerevanensis]
MVEQTASRIGAVWSYLGAALVGFTFVGIFVIWLVPLVIRARTRNPWTRAHATHAANFGFTVLFALFGGGMVSALFGLTASYPETQPLPILLWSCYTLVGLVALLVGALRTGLGQDFRFVKTISLRLLG